MVELLVFGGTVEGRHLVEWLDARETCTVVACAATEYGVSLLAGSDRVSVLQGPLSAEQKRQLIQAHNFCCIVDATHPFAQHITASVRTLGEAHGLDVLRVVREQDELGQQDNREGQRVDNDQGVGYGQHAGDDQCVSDSQGTGDSQRVGNGKDADNGRDVDNGQRVSDDQDVGDGQRAGDGQDVQSSSQDARGNCSPWTSVDDAAQAAALLAHTQGNVLLTTGTKDLLAFTQAIEDYRDRLYVRILPVADALKQTASVQIPASHVIAMQGPFSQELNEALIRQFDIAWLVTKQSGSSGGFGEKVAAAHTTDTQLVVIKRPTEEGGYTLEEMKMLLEKRYGV